MLSFRKLMQPLPFRSLQFYKNAKFLPRRCKKVLSLSNITDNNTDIHDSIIKEELSDAEWHNVRERCLQVQQVTPSIVDSTIIDLCTKEARIDKAIAYFKFLRGNRYSLNPAVIGKYLKLYSLRCGSLSDEDKTEIVETYDDLRRKYPVLDAVTAEQCIMSMSLTDQWERTFEIMEMLKITSLPGNNAYSALIAATFRNKRPDIGWKMLSEMMSYNLTPQDVVFTTYLSHCESEGREAFNKNMTKMFDFWTEYSILARNHVVDAYIETAGKYGWFGNPTAISKTGTCKHCGESLSNVTVSDDSFRELVESVMNEVIIGRDVYYKTNPVELNNFKRFVEKTKPYDIIIDGLNVTYFTGKPTELLLDVTNHFAKRNKKILVLTRYHQRKLPIFQEIQKHALVFYINNLSADDPYMLYATMASGKNAMFISADLMRQHKHCLKQSNLHREFKRWQRSHQYFVRKKNRSFYIQEPFVYLSTAQKNGDYWHVPYVADDCNMADSFEFPDKWYCLRQRK